MRSHIRKPLHTLQSAASLAISYFAGTITHVATTDPVIALTFDDGPHGEYTPRLLDILRSFDARATFFMLGEAAKQYPEIVRQVAHEGHAIGNHSWNHPSFPLISGRERRSQIRSCRKAIEPYGTNLFRPPYCDQNLASWIDAFVLGYEVVTYNVCTDDWRGADALSITDQILNRVKPGSVIVLHERLFDALEDGYFDREAVLQAVEACLSRLTGRFEFVTVPELFRRGKPRRKLWLKKTDLGVLNRLITPVAIGRRYSET